MNETYIIPIALILTAIVMIGNDRMKRRKLPPRPLALAHLCRHQGDKETLFCHVKITNPSARDLMTITHVNNPFDRHQDLPLQSELPRTLHGSQIVEFWFRLDNAPSDRETEFLLSGFTVTDSLGRHTKSKPNRTVPKFGAIAR